MSINKDVISGILLEKENDSNHCPECFSTELILENFVQICSDCGNIINDTPISVDKTTKNQSFESKNHVLKYCKSRNRIFKRETVPILLGTKLIETICQKLSIPKRIQESSIDLFKKSSENSEFKFVSTNMKQCLAISCVYIIANQQNYPITLTELANNTDCLLNHIGSVLSRIQKIFPDVFDQSSKLIEFLVPSYVLKHDFDEKEKISIIETAKNLVWMWREAILVQGFNPIYVIYSALFFAWKSIDHNRASKSLAEFCDEYQIVLNLSLQRKVKYFFKILKQFVISSPCFMDDENEITVQNISLKIPQLVQWKKIIVFNYNQQHQQNFDTKKIDEIGRKRQQNQSSSLETKCLKNSDENNFDDLEGDDLSDNELDCYIRTAKEIEEIEKFHLQTR
ncbi:histone-lysine N-methyltransferase [Sarcoptes scabiei]|nr:histone-lysine N-methyltransferase [Sarcoptes scabiei]